MNRTRQALGAVLLAAIAPLAAGCDEDLDVDRGLEPSRSSVVSGDVVIVAPLPEPHPVVLFLNMVVDPTGTPLPQPTTIDVTVVPASVLSEGGDGVRTGPFAFGLVPPAVYVVAGIVDVDENFDVLVPALAAPSAPDLPGGYADLATGQLIPIRLRPNEVAGEITVVFAPPPGG